MKIWNQWENFVPISNATIINYKITFWSIGYIKLSKLLYHFQILYQSIKSIQLNIKIIQPILNLYSILYSIAKKKKIKPLKCTLI